MTLLTWTFELSCPPDWPRQLERGDGSFFQSPAGVRLWATPASEPWYARLFRGDEQLGIAAGLRRPCRLSRVPRHYYLPTVPALWTNDYGHALKVLLECLHQQGAAQIEIDSFDARVVPYSEPFAGSERQRLEHLVPLDSDPHALVHRCTETHRRHLRRGDRERWTLRPLCGEPARQLLFEVQVGAAARAERRGQRFLPVRIAAHADETFAPSPAAHWGTQLFSAWDADAPLAAALVGWANRRAFYITGGSTPEGYRRSAAVWLHYQIMQVLAAHGHVIYNLGGSPARAAEPDHASHGLYRFKTGFGGQVVICRGAEWIPRPWHERAHRAARRLVPSPVASNGDLRPRKDRLRERIANAALGRLQQLRAHPLSSPAALVERWREYLGGHPVAEQHHSHLLAAIGWLERAQDATPDDGFSRGYSLTHSRYFGGRGWQPSYPETTGYIIPTLYEAAERLSRRDLADRADRAARWEVSIQLPSGAVRAGVIGQPTAPAVFNTGQVILGWLRAFEVSGDGTFADAAVRAGRFLAGTIERDGLWRSANSPFADPGATFYNARTAWALAEAGRRLNQPRFIDAASRSLQAVAERQRPNGWLPECCLTDPSRPLLHTLAYAIRGLLEGGRVLEDESHLRRGILAAEHLAELVRPDGWMAGRFDETWRPAVAWSCLTGEAQMANAWLRLHAITGDSKWLEPVPSVLRFLKSTQNRSSGVGGLRGGIKGSAPLNGHYAPYEVVNWATKFFVDALLRHQDTLPGGQPGRAAAYTLG